MEFTVMYVITSGFTLQAEGVYAAILIMKQFLADIIVYHQLFLLYGLLS
jgi:hypothetical protein